MYRKGFFKGWYYKQEKGGQAVQLLLSQPPGKGCGDSSRTRGRGIAPGPVMKDRQTDHPRTMLCGRPPGGPFLRPAAGRAISVLPI